MMKEKTPLYKSELLEELPDGTLRYHVVRTRRPAVIGGTLPKVHECPHCGGTIYYRFVTDGEVLLEAYLDDEPRTE